MVVFLGFLWYNPEKVHFSKFKEDYSMATTQTFRSALNGFHREDVVRYLEYLNTKHQNQVNQLTAEAESLRAQLEDLHELPQQDPALEEALETVTRERDALRAQLEELQAQTQAQTPAEEPQKEEPSGLTGIAAQELEAYRRAERLERTAREKAELVYHQASGVLNEATAKIDGITDDITAKADEVMAQLTQLQMAVSSSKQALQEAASLMNTIRPNI